MSYETETGSLQHLFVSKNGIITFAPVNYF